MAYAVFAYAFGATLCWLHCARCTRRSGCWKEDGRIAAVSTLWALLWPLTAVFVGLGYVVRWLAERDNRP